MSFWTGSSKIHELYTAACGLYVCWLSIRGVTVLLAWMPQGRTVIVHKVQEWTLMVGFSERAQKKIFLNNLRCRRPYFIPMSWTLRWLYVYSGVALHKLHSPKHIIPVESQVTVSQVIFPRKQMPVAWIWKQKLGKHTNRRRQRGFHRVDPTESQRPLFAVYIT